MGGVRHEPFLAGEGGIETFEHHVERVSQLLELVIRATQRKPLAEPQLGRLACRIGDRPNRLECASGAQAAERHGNDCDDRKADQQSDPQRPQSSVALVGARAELGKHGVALPLYHRGSGRRLAQRQRLRVLRRDPLEWDRCRLGEGVGRDGVGQRKQPGSRDQKQDRVEDGETGAKAPRPEPPRGGQGFHRTR